MTKYNGPLFIVGNPRSGTKLLRDLLNRNPKINILEIESNFIPSLVQKYGMKCPLEDVAMRDSFFKDFKDTGFYFYSIEKNTNIITREDLDNVPDLSAWDSVFEHIIKVCLPDAPDKVDPVWGDKTPNYVKSVALIKQIFPDARFIHIIRDPRDVALSANKAWGNHYYRTTNKWVQYVNDGQKAKAQFPKDILEVFYEDVISDSETVLQTICDFIDVPFVEQMLNLKQPSENLGDTKGKQYIVKSNKNKFLEELPKETIKRIEEITFNNLEYLKYETFYATEYHPLTKNELLILSMSDALSTLRHDMKMWGQVRGMQYFFRYRIKTRLGKNVLDS